MLSPRSDDVAMPSSDYVDMFDRDVDIRSDGFVPYGEAETILKAAAAVLTDLLEHDHPVRGRFLGHEVSWRVLRVFAET